MGFWDSSSKVETFETRYGRQTIRPQKLVDVKLDTKGKQELEAGYFYAPYVPLMSSRVQTLPDVDEPHKGSVMEITPAMMMHMTEQFQDRFKGGSAYFIAHDLIGSTSFGSIDAVGFAFDISNRAVAFTMVCREYDNDYEDMADAINFFTNNPFDLCLLNSDETLDISIQSCYIQSSRPLGDGFSVTINVAEEAIQDDLFTIGERNARHYFT